MSETPRKGFNKKPKFEVRKVKFLKKRSIDSNDVPERIETRRPSTNSRDESDGKESSDLKRKRVYAERGVERGGKFNNGDLPNRKSFSRIGKEEGFKRNGGVKDDVSDFDRQNRMKFSSQKDESSGDRGRKKEYESPRGYKGRSGKFDGKSGFARRDESVERSGTEGFESWKGYKGKDGTFISRNIQREGISEERNRKKEFESPRGVKGGANRFDAKSSFNRGKRMGREEGVDRKEKTTHKTRERLVSTKRDLDDNSDTNLKLKAKTRDRRPSAGQDDVSDGRLKMKVKKGGRGLSPRQNDVKDDLQKQNSKKTDSSRQLPPKTNNLGEGEPIEKSTKKQLRPKKYDKKEDSSEDGPPKKKKKKVMRIAPDDISNKRIDDGISFDGKTAEKTVDPDEKLEMSKNAQFRAIQPTPSILSFVEENLLGRRRSIDLRRAGYNIDLSAPLDNIPLSTSTERERIEESVFRNKLEFYAAAKVASSFPPAELPEIAFAGRSNVGKSSLLNALTRQWGVVRTSDKPGLTQTINFFKLGSKLSMVDLPGYGFAYAKEEVKDAWEELVKEYVSTRMGLKRVCLLIDTKWGMKPRDHELINLMERSQTKYQIVLTKSDLVFPIDVARRAMQIEETLKAHKSVVQPVMMISSKTGGGIRSLRTVLAMIARFAK